jgi:hypothetical protein
LASRTRRLPDDYLQSARGGQVGCGRYRQNRMPRGALARRNVRHQAVKVVPLKLRPFSEWRVIRPEQWRRTVVAHTAVARSCCSRTLDAVCQGDMQISVPLRSASPFRGAAFVEVLMGYGMIRSAWESSAGGKVNPRLLAVVLLRVR